MSDVASDILELLQKIDNGTVEGDDLEVSTIFVLLSRAMNEIERIRNLNAKLSWKSNPDRMGGQFTQDEIEDAKR